MTEECKRLAECRVHGARWTPVALAEVKEEEEEEQRALEEEARKAGCCVLVGRTSERLAAQVCACGCPSEEEVVVHEWRVGEVGGEGWNDQRVEIGAVLEGSCIGIEFG